MNNLTKTLIASLISLLIIIATVLFNIALLIDSNVHTYVSIYMLVFINMFIVSVLTDLNCSFIKDLIAEQKAKKIASLLTKKGYKVYIDKANFIMIDSNLEYNKQKAIQKLCFIKNVCIDTYL